MRLTLILILTVVWLYGEVSGYTLGGFINVLPVLAIILVLFGGHRHHPV